MHFSVRTTAHYVVEYLDFSGYGSLIGRATVLGSLLSLIRRYSGFLLFFLLLAVLLSGGLRAQPSSDVTAQLSTEQLKTAYLECERAALIEKLGSGDAMLCSVIYEDLKYREFGGDFLRLKAWADAILRPQTN